MSEKRILLNKVPESPFRGSGAWSLPMKGDRVGHFFVSLNPYTQMAISKCRSLVKPLENLIAAEPLQKCLICDLYVRGSEEVIKAG